MEKHHRKIGLIIQRFKKCSAIWKEELKPRQAFYGQLIKTNFYGLSKKVYPISMSHTVNYALLGWSVAQRAF